MGYTGVYVNGVATNVPNINLGSSGAPFNNLYMAGSLIPIGTTGPTGATNTTNTDIGSYTNPVRDIYVSNSIMPVGDTVRIGSTGYNFSELFVNANTVYIGDARLSSVGSTLSLPSGSKIGGVDPGTVTIKGTKANSGALPVDALVGDAWVIGSNLYVCSVAPNTWVNIGQFVGPQGPIGYTGYTGYTGSPGSADNTGATGYTGYTGYTGPQGTPGIASNTGATGYTGYTGYTGPQGTPGEAANTGATGYTGYTGYTGAKGDLGTVGTIDVYFSGTTYLSKVVVNNYISSTATFTFSGPTNTSITITNLNANFNDPISIVSWGLNFGTSATPTKRRMVQLMNHTACVIEYDSAGSGTLTLSNATLNNLGIASFDYLTTSETKVATLYLTYQIL
jgi:hypothetical protein